MHRALGLLLLCTPLGSTLALAQAPATHDLRADYKFKVGDKVRVAERNENHAKWATKTGTKVHESYDKVEGYEQRYEEEVQAVDAAGRVTKAVRTYTLVSDLATEQTLDLKAKPLKVQLSVGDDGMLGFAAVDANAPIPEVLQAILDVESGEHEAGGGDEGGDRRRVLPETPVAVGAAWQVPLDKVCEQFEIEAADVKTEGYEGKGVLEAADPAGDVATVRAVVTIKLPLKSFNGLTCSTPMAFDMTIRMRLAPAGAAPDRQNAMEGNVKGVAEIPQESGYPAGTVMDLEMHLVKTETVERIK